ncbi:hypothetical protein TNCV_2982681 [Trichonephila clavipes]|nr:hypothetical protein TNCV_2982681 [Trichonephila clavipes]
MNDTSGHPMMRNRLNVFVLWFMMLLPDPSLPCAQYFCHHGQCCNGVGTIGPVGLSFSPASRDDRFTSQLLGSVKHVDRFL